MTERDESATPGERLWEIRSPDGRWRAWAEFLSDESVQTAVEGGGRTERFPSSRPIAFGMDNRRLVLARAGDGLVEGLHVLVLEAGMSTISVTNQNMRQAPGPLPETHVPCPIDTTVSWLGSHLTYTVPGDGHFDVNIDNGEVRRGPP